MSNPPTYMLYNKQKLDHPKNAIKIIFPPEIFVI